MDVDSPSVIPRTPNVDEYGSVGDSDDLSRRTTPAFFEQEPVELKNGRESSNEDQQHQGQQHGSNGASASYIAPDVTYEMDLDNSEDDEQPEVQQITLQAQAHRNERASSTSSSVNLKASTRGKRKHAASSAAESRRHSPASTPAPTVDSTTLAVAPILVPSTVPGFFTTRNIPMNKQSYRYTACGPSPNYRQALQLFRMIPSPPADVVRFSWEDRSTYVGISPDAMAIATDKGWRSARVNVPMREGAYYFEVLIERGADDPNGLTKGDGFGPHVRVGLARREAPLNAPVGYDAYSYGIRDKTGDKVHISKPRAYGEPLNNDDVLGIYVYLPPRPTPSITADQPEYALDTANPARIVRKRIPIRVKGQLYFEQMEYAPSKEMEDLALMTKDPAAFEKAKQAAEAALKQKSAPPPGRRRAPPPPMPPPPRPLPLLHGSKIAFFKNGKPLGVAFEDLFDYLPLRQQAKSKTSSRMSIANQIAMARENYHDDGTLGYYPMVSVFGGGTARLNPGPHFRCPPPADVDSTTGGASRNSDELSHVSWRPLSERYREYLDEQWRLDSIEEAIAVAAFEQKAALAAANAAQQQRQSQHQHQQHNPAAQYNMSNGVLSTSTSPRPIYNENHCAATVKRKTGLSNELIPIRDKTDSPEPGHHMEASGIGNMLFVKQEEEETDADGEGDTDAEGASPDQGYAMHEESEAKGEDNHFNDQ